MLLLEVGLELKESMSQHSQTYNGNDETIILTQQNQKGYEFSPSTRKGCTFTIFCEALMYFPSEAKMV